MRVALIAILVLAGCSADTTTRDQACVDLAETIHTHHEYQSQWCANTLHQDYYPDCMGAIDVVLAAWESSGVCGE
jgi:hypothetical protein